MSHTLLLADDSVTIRRVIELTFADEGVAVQSVSSGREALERIAAEPPDIVLADIGMADVSGYDIAAHIKSRDDLRRIPVVLLAGAFEPLDEARARQVGSDAVLVKPFEPQMVVARVRELLERPSTTRVATPPAAARTVPATAVTPPQQPPDARTTSAAARAAVDVTPEEASAGAAPLARPHANDSRFDESLDRLDAAFAGTQAPELDATAISDFAQDLEQLRAHRGSGAFARDEFGDWDLPSRVSPAAELDIADPPLSVRRDDPAGVLSEPERVVQPDPAPAIPPIPESVPAPAPVPPLPPPVALEPRPRAPETAPRSVPAAPAASTPLADAFSSLLAAEEGRGHAVAAQGRPVADLSDEAIDRIVDKVVARLGAGVRGTVVDVAERLVRDEIARLKDLR